MPTPAATRAEVAKRRAEALELKRAGLTHQEIADRLGHRSRAAAAQDVRRALDQVVTEPAREIRLEEVARLDAMLTGLWSAARKGNVNAVDRVLKIMERRAKLLGLDAPTQHEVIPLDAIEAEIARLTAELGETGTPPGAATPQEAG